MMIVVIIISSAIHAVDLRMNLNFGFIALTSPFVLFTEMLPGL
jgi:hypothetical protein